MQWGFFAYNAATFIIYAAKYTQNQWHGFEKCWVRDLYLDFLLSKGYNVPIKKLT